MISINTDIGSLLLQNTLNNNTIGLNNSIERMTTGYKINHAKDDAAGFTVSEKLSSKIDSMLKVQENSEHGIALLQTAEGGLNNILDLLQRLRDLAEQAANEVYAEDSRIAMQAEADQIIEEIQRIRNSTEFNGLNLFEGKQEGDSGVTTFSTRSVILRNSHIRLNTNQINDSRKNILQLTKTLSPRVSNIEGAEDFGANETRTITIDGIDYTVQNRQSSAQTLSYTKDTATGEITFIGNYFTIRGQTDIRHNILIKGRQNMVYGGDLEDTFRVLTGSSSNTIYGGNGNDNITIDSGGGASAYGQDGNDTIINNNGGYTLDGGNGDDNINTVSGSSIYGRVGNDTITIRGNNSTVYGNEGDDTFVITSGSNNYINGGDGNNSITDNGTNTQKVNVPGANIYEITLAGRQTITQNINGIDYEIVNNSASSSNLSYRIESNGAINFMKGTNFTISGDVTKAHNVIISTNSITFNGGNLSDTIRITGAIATVHAGGGNDIINLTGQYHNTIYGDGGNDTISATGGNRQYLNGGEGDDTITTSATNSFVYGENGDDHVVNSGRNSTIYDNFGSNTITNNSTGTMIYGFGNSDNVDAAVEFGANETKSVTINGKIYEITNNSTNRTAVLYSHNPVTDEITFSAYQATIRGESNVVHNINLYGGRTNFYGGNLEDKINIYTMGGNIYTYDGDDNIIVNEGQSAVYCGNGDDNIELNSSSAVYAESGNDTITANVSIAHNIDGGIGDDTYNLNNRVTSQVDAGGNNIYNINTNNSSISGSSDDDTFYVNGNNNIILGQGGNDYFVVDGDNNMIDGGTGDNYHVINGSGSSVSNVTSDPNSGGISFTYQGEVQTFTLNGKTYTVTNNSSATNMLQYSLNPNTGVITLNGSDFSIDAGINESAILNIRGDNNTINGSDLADRIIIEQGNNNTINGLGGNDVLTMESENNSINGDDGNDTITVNSSTTAAITGGNGNDAININSDNNTNIDAGDGNNSITLSGLNNVATAGDGDNTIISSGNNNTLDAGNGDNHFTITGNNSIFTAGAGNNTVGIQGNENIFNADTISGTINVIGDKNEVTHSNGNNTITIRGNENIYNSDNGDKIVNITGNSNSISTTDGNDKFNIKGNNNAIETTGGDNSIEIDGNINNYIGGIGIDSVTIHGDSNHLETGDSNDTFMIADGRNNYIDGNAGDRNTMINNGVNTDYHNVVDITPRPFKLALQVDIGSGIDDVINLEISFNLFDFKVDFMDSDEARRSLDDIDELIAKVQEQILNIGATINRLESVNGVQTVKIDNLISSLSTVKDVDISEESSNFIRNQILQNATTTLQTSARNFRGEMLLGILGGTIIN